MSALLGAEDQTWLDGLRRAHFPPERNQLAAHLTMFHHLPPSVEAELRHRLAQAARQAAPAARLAGLISLGGGTAFRIEAPGLEAIRADLADVFDGMLTPQDQAGWRPHVTIQNKVKPAEARTLKIQLEAGFRPRSIAIRGLASWWYRGGPWEPLSCHMFA